MAKALIGYIGGPDPAVAAELARLRRRVRELDAEVARLSAANAALTDVVAERSMVDITDHELVVEPVLS